MRDSLCTVSIRRTAFFAVLLSGTLQALGSTTAPRTTSTPTAAPYIEAPQPTVTTVTTMPTYSTYSDYHSSSYYSNSGFGSYTTTSTTYYPRRYFFPPNPPALGETYVKNRSRSASLVRSTIPLALSDYINEPFYSPLSPFLHEEHVSKRRQKVLDDYTAAKGALTRELRAKLDATQNLQPAAREAELAAFAQQQTPRIAAVEKMAYEIRDDLTQWHLFGDSSDWNEGRSWRLGDNTRWESTLDDAKVMRGAAFFQNGLSPAQRRLLREFAMELDDSGREPTADIALDARGPFFYFAPEMSRIRLPGNLPAELSAKIADYRKRKAAIKKELRDTLYQEDRRWFDSHRTAALRTLAEKQAPEIAALDPLAEDIRRGLALLPNPSRPPLPNQTLPGPLADRLNRYMKDKLALQQTLADRLSEVRQQFPGSRVEYVRSNDAFVMQLVPRRRLATDEASRVETIRTQLTSFNDEQVRTFTRLVQEKAAIREELVQAAGPLSSVVTPKVVDLILSEYSRVLQQQELWSQFRDYENAVLLPGLSPEQRRLLFDAALVRLDPQLPFYTY